MTFLEFSGALISLNCVISGAWENPLWRFQVAENRKNIYDDNTYTFEMNDLAVKQSQTKLMLLLM